MIIFGVRVSVRALRLDGEDRPEGIFEALIDGLGAGVQRVDRH